MGRNGIETPFSPEVRAHMERQFADVLKGLTDEHIGRVSLNPAEQRLGASAIDLLDDSLPNEAWFDGDHDDNQELVEAEPSLAAQTSPEAEVVATIERQSSEGHYQIIATTTPVCAKVLHQYGLAHPEAIVARVRDDYELAA